MHNQNLTNFSHSAVASSIFQPNIYGTIAIGLISLLAILGNSVILFLLFARIKAKLYSNILFTTLALSDLLIGLVVIPFERSMSWTVYEFDKIPWLQQLINWTIFSQTSISLYMLVLLTLHRLQLITRPFKTTEQITRHRLAIIVAIWLGIYLYVGVCCVLLALIANLPTLVAFIFIFFTSILPMVVIVIFNIWTIMALREKAKKNKAANLNNNKSASNQRDAKAITCLVLISLIKFVSQGFLLFILIISLLGAQFNFVLVLLAQLLSYINSCLDPLVVFLFHEAIRIQFCKIFSDFRACLK